MITILYTFIDNYFTKCIKMIFNCLLTLTTVLGVTSYMWSHSVNSAEPAPDFFFIRRPYLVRRERYQTWRVSTVFPISVALSAHILSFLPLSLYVVSLLLYISSFSASHSARLCSSCKDRLAVFLTLFAFCAGDRLLEAHHLIVGRCWQGYLTWKKVWGMVQQADVA